MTESLQLSPQSLILSFSLVLIPMFVIQKENLGLTKELVVAVLRMIIQLAVVSFVLGWVFDLNSNVITLVLMIFMGFNAAWNASKRAGNIPNSLKISIAAVFISCFVSLLVMLLVGGLNFIPQQMIPITGMLVGNSMNVTGLSFRNLNTTFKDQRQQISEKLALGATTKQASTSVVREAIAASLQPSIDSTKMIGLVTLPGMMTGMLFAGADPTLAITYQIMIMLMFISTASLTAIIATYMAYPSFYTQRGQLKV